MSKEKVPGLPLKMLHSDTCCIRRNFKNIVNGCLTTPNYLGLLVNSAYVIHENIDCFVLVL